MKEIDRIWQEYEKSHSEELKEYLIIHYTPLIKHVAGRLSVHLGQHVEFDELLSYGVFGLLDAIDKFDLSKGFKFETYASLRIKGAIIDNIRKMDWIPRTMRQKYKQIAAAHDELESINMRPPTDEEMAEKMDVSVSEYREMLRKSNVQALISLDEYMVQNNELVPKAPSSYDNPESNYDFKELKATLTEAIEKLSEKEKLVVNLYYFEELTLKEISKIMNVSESRISQLHSKAVMKLQTRLTKQKYLL